MKNSFAFFLLLIVLFSCHQQKRGSTTATANKNTTNATTKDTTTGSIIKDTATAMNTQLNQYRNQLEQGIDFIASGTEPFWSLEIDFDKTIHFKMVSGLDITTPAVAGVKAMDADVTRYAAETEKGRLIVQIMRLECTNDMSGKKSPYRVTVEAKYNTDKDLKRYEGCGQYLYDYRINDIWVLEGVNNKKPDVSDFTKGLPQLEINIAQQKVFGHTGCNNINGAMEVIGKRIRFGYLVSTKMACPNMDFENKYFNSLSRQTIPYFIEPGKLHLQVNTDSTFIYRKID